MERVERDPDLIPTLNVNPIFINLDYVMWGFTPLQEKCNQSEFLQRKQGGTAESHVFFCPGQTLNIWKTP